MGTYNGLFRIGSLVGMLFGGILADIYGLQPVAVSFGLFAFLALPFVFRFIRQTGGQQSTATQVSTKPSRIIWKDPTVLGTLATGFFTVMALESMFTSTLSHLIETRYPGSVVLWNISVGAAALTGILQAIRWTSGMWLSPWAGRVTDGKWGRSRVLITVLAVATALLATIPLQMPAAIWIMVLMAVLITSTLLTTIVDTLASDAAAGSEKIAVMTAYAMALDIGAAMGPLFGYSIENLLGLSNLYWLSACILLVIAAKWIFSIKREPQHTTYPM
jgi:predicted MFS family arabinose efflux permease